MSNRLRRILNRWRFGRMSVTGTSALPIPTEQQAVLTDEDKFKRDHGFSAATTPAPWTEDIARHNAQADRDYAAAVQELKDGYLAGTYRPRFLMFEDLADERVGAIMAGDKPTVDEVNWHLEMTLQRGARENVTKIQPLWPVLTDADAADAREAGNLARVVAGLERQQGLHTLDTRMQAARLSPIRQAIGTREQILQQCGGNTALADAVERKAREEFGVEDLDAVPESV